MKEGMREVDDGRMIRNLRVRNSEMVTMDLKGLALGDSEGLPLKVDFVIALVPHASVDPDP